MDVGGWFFLVVLHVCHFSLALSCFSTSLLFPLSCGKIHMEEISLALQHQCISVSQSTLAQRLYWITASCFMLYMRFSNVQPLYDAILCVCVWCVSHVYVSNPT